MRWILVLFLCIGCHSAQALSPTSPKEPWWVGVTFEEESSKLSDQLQRQLRVAIEEIPQRCTFSPPVPGIATIEYRFAPESMPRNDYQLIGNRIQEIRTFLIGFRPMKIAVSIEALEPPNVRSLDGVADHRISVRFNCL